MLNPKLLPICVECGKFVGQNVKIKNRPITYKHIVYFFYLNTFDILKVTLYNYCKTAVKSRFNKLSEASCFGLSIDLSGCLGHGFPEGIDSNTSTQTNKIFFFLIHNLCALALSVFLFLQPVTQKSIDVQHHQERREWK